MYIKQLLRNVFSSTKNQAVKPAEILEVPELVQEWFESKGLPIELLDVWYVYEMGAAKHGRNTWLDKDNPSMSRLSNEASMFRHLRKHQMNTAPDEESGLSHLLHIIARASMKYARIRRGVD